MVLRSKRTLFAGSALAFSAIGAMLALRLARPARRAEPADSGAPAEAHPRPRWAVLAVLGLAAVSAAGLLGWKAYQDRRQTEAIAIALTLGDPAHRPALMRRYGCAGCHTIPGVPGADGRTAPRLDGLCGQVYIAGVARNGGETLVRLIHDPQSLSPRSAVPKTGISEAEARDVAAWLYSR